MRRSAGARHGNDALLEGCTDRRAAHGRLSLLLVTPLSPFPDSQSIHTALLGESAESLRGESRCPSLLDSALFDLSVACVSTAQSTAAPKFLCCSPSQQREHQGPGSKCRVADEAFGVWSYSKACPREAVQSWAEHQMLQTRSLFVLQLRC